MSRPKLLDLFCCEGGASEGYRRAGFDVYGIDLFKHTNAKGKRVGFSQSRYPFPSIARFAPDVAHLLAQVSSTRDRDQKERLARGLRGGKP